jgi:ApaG protein
MYRKSTHNIEVSVLPVYIDERSDPSKQIYFWAYRVQISNHGEEEVQLLTRYWHITNALGVIEEVSGKGVVGEQPVISPGGQFEYTSGCPLTTPSGIMVGHYDMKSESGETLRVMIPAFSLDLPDAEPIYN